MARETCRLSTDPLAWSDHDHRGVCSKTFVVALHSGSFHMLRAIEVYTARSARATSSHLTAPFTARRLPLSAHKGHTSGLASSGGMAAPEPTKCLLSLCYADTYRITDDYSYHSGYLSLLLHCLAPGSFLLGAL